MHVGIKYKETQKFALFKVSWAKNVLLSTHISRSSYSLSTALDFSSIRKVFLENDWGAFVVKLQFKILENCFWLWVYERGRDERDFRDDGEIEKESDRNHSHWLHRSSRPSIGLHFEHEQLVCRNVELRLLWWEKKVIYLVRCLVLSESPLIRIKD